MTPPPLRGALTALLLGLSSLAARPAQAADLRVLVTTPAGAPVANAVVMFERPGAPPPRPGDFDWPLVMEQRDLQFRPFVLIVPVGSEVAFPNHDTVRHHVYSFSPAKTFELRLYGQDETRVVRFDKPGVVALGCNIHDNMSAFVRVVDTPYAARTDARGEAVIADAPAGAGTLVAWHPYVRGGRDLTRRVTAGAAGQTLRMTMDVRPPPLRRDGY
jgi:plastocyanin